MDNDTYIEYLDQKLNEELAEYQQDKSVEELADLYLLTKYLRLEPK